MARSPERASVTELLSAAQGGDPEALDSLFPLVYEELRSLARSQRARWQGNLTMNATAIVNEAYIKLLGQGAVESKSRGHFFALAARAMRQILCNYARDRKRVKRGGGAEVVPLEDALYSLSIDLPEEQAAELSALDEALQRLEQVNQRQSQIVECRFFGGLSIDDTAVALGISPATVKRDWAMARAWLYREIRSQ